MPKPGRRSLRCRAVAAALALGPRRARRRARRRAGAAGGAGPADHRFLARRHGGPGPRQHGPGQDRPARRLPRELLPPPGPEGAAAGDRHRRGLSQRRPDRRRADRQQHRGRLPRPPVRGLGGAGDGGRARGRARRPDGHERRLRFDHHRRPVPEQLARHRAGPVAQRPSTAPRSFP
ncbi:MAG: hypothetical protein WDM92_09985 [Caulobacteraceae bacterium]